MIKYDLNTINDWNFGDDNIIKVYRHNAVCYYKIVSSGGTSGQTPCFAVVDDISQYSDTEFEDVFNKADNKWYKLNNLNQYEQYGIYGSGRTSCEGSTSRLPQGYTEVEYIENTSTAYINTGFKPNQNTKILITTQCVTSTSGGRHIGAGGYDGVNAIQYDYENGATGTLHISWGGYAGWSVYNNCVGDYNKHTYEWDGNTFYRDKGTANEFYATTGYTTYQCTDNLGIFTRYQNGSGGSSSECFRGKVFDFKMYDNSTLVRDLVPAKRDSDDKYGMYDLVTNTFYLSPNNVDFSGGEPITPDCVTTYEGKLTIDDGYEYEWNGSSWINVGEVSGSSITIKSPEYIEKDSSHNGKINLDYVWKTNSKMQFKFYSTKNGGGAMIGEDGTPDNNDCRMFFASATAYFDWGRSRISWPSNGRANTLYEYEYGNYYIKNMVTSASKTGSTISTSRTNTLYLGYGGTDRFRTYYLKFYDGDTLVKDFIPWTDTNGNYGLYEKVSNTIYSATSGSFTASSVWNDVEVGGGYEYPLEYVVREDPPDNIVFSSMTEAEEYECPWVGMQATIDGDNYIFSGDSISGYEWVYVPSRLPSGYTEVEYVENTSNSTVNLGIQLMANVGDTYGVVLDNEMSYTSGYGDLQTFLTCCKEVATVYPGWYYRYNSSTNIVIAGSNGINLSTGRTLVSGSTYHVTVTGSTGTDRNHDWPLNLFSSLDSNKSPWRFCKGKLYNMQVTYNNTLVRDLVPCYRKSDNVAGLYDLVNNVFYSSASGYDQLVAGNPV